MKQRRCIHSEGGPRHISTAAGLVCSGGSSRAAIPCTAGDMGYRVVNSHAIFPGECLKHATGGLASISPTNATCSLGLGPSALGYFRNSPPQTGSCRRPCRAAEETPDQPKRGAASQKAPRTWRACGLMHSAQVRDCGMLPRSRIFANRAKPAKASRAVDKGRMKNTRTGSDLCSSRRSVKVQPQSNGCGLPAPSGAEGWKARRFSGGPLVGHRWVWSLALRA